jgi:hypothetical protein
VSVSRLGPAQRGDADRPQEVDQLDGSITFENKASAPTNQAYRVLGADPGIRGGLAIVGFANGGMPQVVDAIDVPTVGVDAKERINVHALRDWIMRCQPQHAVIERAGSMPKEGVASTFKYARAVGAIEAVIACCKVPLTIVEPAAWKNFTDCTRRPARPRPKSKKHPDNVRSNYFLPRMRCLRAGRIMARQRPC